MRLLAVIICILSALCSSLTLAGENCNKTSLIKKDILQCADDIYVKVDKKLNLQYSIVIAQLSPTNKKLLTEGERAWIRYRDAHCRNVFESILPGTEAGIEQVGCLISLTSFRLAELLYLETGAGGGGFHNALSFASSMSSKNRDQLLSYIEKLKRDPEEAEYHKKNCELTLSIHREDEIFCRARMKFQSM